MHPPGQVTHLLTSVQFYHSDVLVSIHDHFPWHIHRVLLPVQNMDTKAPPNGRTAGIFRIYLESAARCRCCGSTQTSLILYCQYTPVQLCLKCTTSQTHQNASLGQLSFIAYQRVSHVYPRVPTCKSLHPYTPRLHLGLLLVFWGCGWKNDTPFFWSILGNLNTLITTMFCQNLRIRLPWLSMGL